MYSQRVIEWTLDDFARQNGWRPEPHSVAEIEEFDAKIKSVTSVDRNSVSTYYDFKDGIRLTERDRKHIRRWVENEQFMCFADAEYFKTRYAFILGVGDEIIRYKPRVVQQILHSILAEFDDQQVAIELFILKCRQLGVSTDIALNFLHRILFRVHTRAVMASVKQKQSDLLQRMIDVCWNQLPFWLPPHKTVTKTSQPEWSNGSVLSMQSGSQNVGIAQGWTPGCIHISELGDYMAPKKTLVEGLFPAAHSHRNLFFAMEGTGNGDTTWQANFWRYSKKSYGHGGRFRPLFFPPAAAEDMYPLPDWIRKNPVPVGWSPRIVTERMRKRAELYVRSTEYLSRFLGSNWSMKKEYAYFWEVKYLAALADHTEKVWLAQMACTDEEALQGAHDKAVDDDVITVVTKTRDRGYVAYAITGKTILMGNENKPYEPPEESIDNELPRIELEWTAPDDNVYRWELVPLKPFNDDEDDQCFDKLLIFEAPIKGEKYSAGVDCADGLGLPNEDRACCSVLKNKYGKGRDTQVAEFVSNRVNSPQMARIVACISVLYGEESSDPMGVKLAIEQRRKPGDECQHQLKIMGFFNHHRYVRYDSKGMPDPSKAIKEGWYTDTWSRPMLLDKYLDAVKNGWLKINSPMLMRQMKALVRRETAGQSRIEHPSGGHDDNVFGSAMAYFTRHDMDNNALRSKQRYEEEEEDKVEINMGYPSQAVAID